MPGLSPEPWTGLGAARAAGFSDAVSHASLTHGFIPIFIELVTVVALLYGPDGVRGAADHIGASGGGGRSRDRRSRALVLGTLGIASEPAPWPMWLWVALTGFAIAIAIVGWRSAGNWRRNASVFAVSFCLLSTGLTINSWLGYYPTVYAAWGQLADAPLPDETDLHGLKSPSPQRCYADKGSRRAGALRRRGVGFSSPR